jgi:exopolysaccharide biosynthesis polyprenyl glycosylphosphotransferase
VLDPLWFVFADGNRRGALGRAAKQSIDFALGICLLVLTLPIMLLTALAIWFEDGAPVLYRQERVGLNGRRFQILKFRSMRKDAEADGVPRWAEIGDCRVTRVGSLIRRSRADELPQIFNVLRGEMSFVGPRPERPAIIDELSREIPYYRSRHCVKPGITGWAQVSFPYGASVDDAREKLAYDLYYIKNGGLMLDLLILIQTVRVILWPEGSR